MIAAGAIKGRADTQLTLSEADFGWIESPGHSVEVPAS